ncbi:T9SS type A sorting domain-containing protein [Flavobacterium sp.]|uniref:T9SS type A sorting domain-containing protein n=1 Tax=Flavobacterium sp. TaxID=239 RepID=UPI003752156E
MLQPDGKITLVGSFTSYNGIARNRIVRINSDGSLDATFDPGLGANNFIFSIKIQSDSKIIIGGNFTSYNGSARNYIARLNADGTLDTTFTQGSATNGSVFCVDIQSDGKIIIGGGFTSYNGIVKNYIAKLNTNGTLDTSFNIESGPLNGTITTAISFVSIQQDGKIIITGLLNSYNGVARKGIARLNLDGTLDLSFDPGLGTNKPVNRTKIQSDGKIIIVGSFTTYNGKNKFGINRLEINGDSDSSFNPGLGSDSTIRKTFLESSGKIIIGGDFTSYNGEQINKFARLNVDGGVDATFVTGTGPDNSVSFIDELSNGKFIIAGDFSSYNGIPIKKIARLNTDGTLDTTFNTGTATNNGIFSMGLQTDGKILIGGFFTFYNGIASNRIARLNTDGSLDSSFNVGTGPNSSIRAIVIQADGKVIIGGEFTSFNGIGVNRIARLNTDGILDTTFNVGTGLNNIVYSLLLQADGKIIASGAFDNFNQINRKNIARLNSNGTLDTSFNPGNGPSNSPFVSNIQYAAKQTDGRIIISGSFTSFNGISIKKLARLNANGSLDNTFNPGTSADGIKTLTVQSDNKIIIGGDFTSYNGTGRNRIARINSSTLSNYDFAFLNNTKIYPNPAQNVVNVEVDGLNEIEVYDINGRFLLKKQMSENKNVIDISSLSKGIYVLKVSTENGIGNFKIIKE